MRNPFRYRFKVVQRKSHSTFDPVWCVKRSRFGIIWFLLKSTHTVGGDTSRPHDYHDFFYPLSNTYLCGHQVEWSSEGGAKRFAKEMNDHKYLGSTSAFTQASN